MIKLPESTDQALRKQIFDLLGWKFEVKDHLIYAIRPDGYHYPSDLFWPNAWEHVPDWPRKIADAFELLSEDPGAVFELKRLRHTWGAQKDLWHAHFRSSRYGLVFGHANAQNAARAISEAWVNMRDSEKEFEEFLKK